MVTQKSFRSDSEWRVSIVEKRSKFKKRVILNKAPAGEIISAARLRFLLYRNRY